MITQSIAYRPAIGLFELSTLCCVHEAFSASEMTYIVSGGALNSTHSPVCIRLMWILRRPPRIARRPRSWDYCAFEIAVDLHVGLPHYCTVIICGETSWCSCCDTGICT